MKRREPPAVDTKAVDTAWKIHQAQMDWTGRVDTKAAFAFGLESAAVATVVGLSAMDRIYSTLDGLAANATYFGGLVLLLVAALLAVSVVAPRLGSWRIRQAAKDGYIYFGHARRWKAKDLEARLRTQDVLPQLSRQIIVMADIAWKKHRRTQWSLWIAVIGGLSLVACAYIATHP